MIVDAALAHTVERDADGGEKSLVPGALAGPPEEFEHPALREFRRAVDAAIDRVKEGADALGDIVKLGESELDRALCFGAGGELRFQPLAVGLDFFRLLMEDPGDLAQHVDKSRPAVAGGIREISAAPERIARGREKHGERTATLAAE